MEFFDVLDRRRSVRAYLRTQFDARKMRVVLDAACTAPSAGNLQAFRVVVVENPDTKSALVKAALDQDFIAEAPAVLLFFADQAQSAEKYGPRGSHLFSLQDATIAATYAQLAATASGLACCWVGAFDDRAVTRAVNAPSVLRPVAVMPMGEPAETPARPSHRALDTLCVREVFR